MSKTDELITAIQVIDVKIDELKHNVNDITLEVKVNTRFRQQAGGFITALVVIGGFLGSLITMAINFFRGGN